MSPRCLRLIAVIPLIVLATTPILVAKKPPTYPPFPEADYAAFAAGGTATISGQAFLRTVGGDVKTGAGSDVTLDPVTDYSRVWWDNFGSWWSKKKEIPPDQRFRSARRFTQADAEGKFQFTGLAPGRYFLRSVVVWSGNQGGLVTKEVLIVADQPNAVLLTEVPDRGHPNIWDPDPGLVPSSDRP